MIVAAVVAAAPILAGCGGPSPNGVASKSASQIFTTATDEITGVRSVHIHGYVTKAQGARLTLDLYDGQGVGGGTIGIGAGPVSVVDTAGSLYLRADAAAWTQLSGSAKVGSALGGRWLKTSSSDPQFADLRNLFDLHTLISNLSDGGTLAKGSTATFDGQPAIGIVDRGGGSGTLYVATTGPPYLLGIDGGQAGQLTLDSFGSATLPTAPAGAQSLSAIEAQLSGPS